MTNLTLPYQTGESLRDTPPLEISLLIDTFKRNVWIVGMLFCIFGLFDRGIALWLDNLGSPIEIVQVSIALFFSIGWLVFKPEIAIESEDEVLLPEKESIDLADNPFLSGTRSRMLELKKQHLISQVYTLPFPYLCQIYHLLNPRHLESIHSFSLNNLKVSNVNHLQSTKNGGIIQFQTILETPINALRMWRSPVVEVDLTLHNPFSIELSIPAYNHKKIIVLFTILPLDRERHKFFIDIYSDLAWYKPLLQLVLHLASLLTLLEDLPYLRGLSGRNLARLTRLNRLPAHETMGLFRRFVELYGSRLETV